MTAAAEYHPLMVHEAFVDVGGHRARYLEAGAGWPVILLHAFPLNADMWRPQLERVPSGWRYIAPDLPGFGPSESALDGADGSAQSVAIELMAEHVLTLMDRLEVERAVVGGLSMGGYVAFAVFRRDPGRFTGMVLADTRPQADSPEGRQARMTMLETLEAGGVSAVVDQMLPKLLGETTRAERPDVVRQVRRIAEANDAAGVAGGIKAMMGRPDSSETLARVSCPVLVAVGDEDTLTPLEEAENMQRALSRSRLVVLPRAGHLSNLETPEAFSASLADFLTSNL